jgi:hypothetical protein
MMTNTVRDQIPFVQRKGVQLLTVTTTNQESASSCYKEASTTIAFMMTRSISHSSSSPPPEEVPRRPPRRELPKRTSSIYYGDLSKALFPSTQPKVVRQWIKASGISKFASQHTRYGDVVWPVHDLWANELLLWILPTHMVTHLIKFGVGLVVLLGAFLKCSIMVVVVQQQQQADEERSTTTTNPFVFGWWLWWWWGGRWSLLLLAMMIPTWVYWYYHETLYAIGKPWMDPRIPATANRMEMHVPLRLFESTETAHRAAYLPQLVSSSSSRHDDQVLTPKVLLLETRWIENFNCSIPSKTP